MKPKAVSARMEAKTFRSGFLYATASVKEREIRFAKLPPQQVARALSLLLTLPKLEATAQPQNYTIRVRYDLIDHSLEELEDTLRSAGFHLSNTLYCKLSRALAYYCEETQLHNMECPQRLIKKSNEAYVHAWSHHAHGDHDDTPPDLRHDK